MKPLLEYRSRIYRAEVIGSRPAPLATATRLVWVTTVVQHRQQPPIEGYQARPAYFRPAGSPPATSGRGVQSRSRPFVWRRWRAGLRHELAAGFWAVADWSYLLLDPLAVLREELEFCCGTE